MKNKLPQQLNCLEKPYKRIKRIINKVKNTHSSRVKKYDEKPEKRSNAIQGQKKDGVMAEVLPWQFAATQILPTC